MKWVDDLILILGKKVKLTSCLKTQVNKLHGNKHWGQLHMPPSTPHRCQQAMSSVSVMAKGLWHHKVSLTPAQGIWQGRAFSWKVHKRELFKIITNSVRVIVQWAGYLYCMWLIQVQSLATHMVC